MTKSFGNMTAGDFDGSYGWHFNLAKDLTNIFVRLFSNFCNKLQANFLNRFEISNVEVKYLLIVLLFSKHTFHFIK